MTNNILSVFKLFFVDIIINWNCYFVLAHLETSSNLSISAAAFFGWVWIPIKTKLESEESSFAYVHSNPLCNDFYLFISTKFKNINFVWFIERSHWDKLRYPNRLIYFIKDFWPGSKNCPLNILSKFLMDLKFDVLPSRQMKIELQMVPEWKHHLCCHRKQPISWPENCYFCFFTFITSSKHKNLRFF